MTARISLSLAIHNHQPVGNFGWVYQDVYDHAYRPLVDALDRHRGVRVSLHYTGPLLDWIRAEHPELIADLRALVARGQVEMLGGGYYEPVLASLPERDRHGQLMRMADEVEGLFGARPRGAWLAERVWEPDLPVCLVDAGYDWTILDDSHFRAAAIPEDAMWGAYVTEDQGHLLRVFATEIGLRYRIPFGDPHDVIGYLRDHATEDGHRVGVMGDDGEKFGAWPGTYEHCWTRNRWVDRFFDLLDENADWLTTVTPTVWLDREPPIGRVAVPTASYLEMTEWALPPDESNVFTSLARTAFDHALPEKRYLRGGFWRNFQVRYREIDDLHKQMLRASAKVAAMPDGPARDLALGHLYKGQSNDCYWHGLFGGIYIVHMRLATYHHLIAAEDIADRLARAGAGEREVDTEDEGLGHGIVAGDGASTGDPAATVLGLAPDDALAEARKQTTPALEAAPPDGAALLDTDMDGVPEAYLATPGQVVGVDLADGAGIGSWDVRATRVALAAVMRRRREAYHETLKEFEARGGQDDEGGAARTIHDIVTTKEPNLSRFLVYDDHERRSGLVHVVAPETPTAAFHQSTVVELAGPVDSPYRLVALAHRELVTELEAPARADGRTAPLSIRKTLRLTGGRRDPGLRLHVRIRNRGHEALRADVVVEWNVDLAGGGGNPAAFYRMPCPDGEERLTHDSAGELQAVAGFTFGNDDERTVVSASLEPPADVAWFPIETVSNSEAGFERSYQGSALLLRWPVDLGPGEATDVALRLDVACGRDALAEEWPGA